MNLSAYKTFVFDCDGVLLNSNKIKTEAFRRISLRFGKEVSDNFVKYHIDNGGVSRYKKIEYLLDLLNSKKIKNKFIIEGSKSENFLLNEFASLVINGLLDCEIANGLKELRSKFSNSSWIIVSGSDQKELRSVFAKRKLSHYFDAGIFGSPVSKIDHLTKLIRKNVVQKPAIFFGDSKLDFEVANASNMDFIFVKKWTELHNWEEVFKDEDITHIETLSDLLKI